MPLDQQSVLPSVSGVPWWGAVACAAIPITIGYLVDALAGTELTMFFSVMFFIGCVAAVLMVQNKSLFTAIVQPPLLMIIAVPLAYKTFAVGPTQGLKSLILDIALPLIDRFPTMILTTLLVWIIGAFRLTLYIQEQRSKSGGAGRRRAPTKSAKRPLREPAPAKQPASRRSTARPAAAASQAPGAPTTSRRSADVRRSAQDRSAADTPAPSRSRRASTPRPIPEPPLSAEEPRGVRQPPSAPQPGPDPRTPQRRTRPRSDETPRPRTSDRPRYADQPAQAGQRRRAEAPRQAEPTRRTDPSRRTDPPRRRTDPPGRTAQPPAPEGPTTGRRRRQESVREFAERQGEIPRYRASRQDPGRQQSQEPVRPATTEPDKQPDYPRLPNVRYRD